MTDAHRRQRAAVTIAELARQVSGEQLSHDAALSRAYALGFTDGMTERRTDDELARVVRVSERTHEPEVKS